MIELNIENYLDDEEIKEAAIDGVKQYTFQKCEKFFGGLKESEYRTLFETVCLNYMLDNYKNEVDKSVENGLKYIVTQGLFQPRWYDRNNGTDRLMSEMKQSLKAHAPEFKKAIIERIKNTDEDILRELLLDMASESLSEIFRTPEIEP